MARLSSEPPGEQRMHIVSVVVAALIVLAIVAALALVWSTPA